MQYARDNWLGLVPAVAMVVVGGVQLGWGAYLIAKLKNDALYSTIVTDKEGKVYDGRPALEGVRLLLVVSGSVLVGLGLLLLLLHIWRARRPATTPSGTPLVTDATTPTSMMSNTNNHM